VVEDRGGVAQIVGKWIEPRSDQLDSQLGTSGAESTEAWQQGERVTDPAFGDGYEPRVGQVGQASLATARRTTTVTLSLPPPSSASCTRASHTCLAEVIERSRSRIRSSET
jgi:hypothetical protein